MPTTLRKPRPKSQARIYEHIEPVATKEFVRQELRAELEPIQRDIKWLRWVILALLTVMLGGFALLLAVMFHLDNKTDKRFDKIESLLQKR